MDKFMWDNVVEKIESILQKRRDEIIRDPHKYPLADTKLQRKYKIFGYNELEKATSIRLRNLNDGLGRFPTPEAIIKLAHYLHCSQLETGELMAMAGYIPKELPSGGADPENAIAIRKEILGYLRQPAYLLSVEWNLIDWNQNVIRLLALESIEPTLRKMSYQERNILRLLFDDKLPVYQMIAAAEDWEAMATRNIHGFILDNLFNTQATWFKETVAYLNHLPRFEELYKKAMQADYRYGERMEYVTRFNVPKYKNLLCLRSNFVRLGNANYPQITFFLPADPKTEDVFKDEGFL